MFKKSSAFRQRMVGLFQRRILLFQRLVFPRQFSGANCIGQDRADGRRWNVDIFGSAVRKQGVVNLCSLLSPGNHPQRNLKRHAVGVKKTGRFVRPEVSFVALRDEYYVAHEMVFRWQVMPLASC